MPCGVRVPYAREAGRGQGDDQARGASDQGAGAPCPETCRRALAGYLSKLARTGVPFQICIGPLAVGRCTVPGLVGGGSAAAAQSDTPERADEKAGPAERAGAAVSDIEASWLLPLMPPARSHLLCASTEAEARVEVEVQMADGRRCAGQCGVGVSRRVMSASAAAGVGVSCLAGWALASEVVREVVQRGLPGYVALVSGSLAVWLW